MCCRVIIELYCALFWIQGKTQPVGQVQRGILYCALFWIQGKTAAPEASGTRRLYCALFWIQGKTTDAASAAAVDCTVPYFGFKAKQPK